VEDKERITAAAETIRQAWKLGSGHEGVESVRSRIAAGFPRRRNRCGAFIHRGFRATNRPSRLEATLAHAARDFSIPNAARHETNPLDSSPQNLNEGREAFLARCQTCHGHDGGGLTPIGQSLYPRVPDLRATATQELTDGEIHYIIENGLELTEMPVWGNPHQVQNDDSWKLVPYIRSLRPLTQQEQLQQTKASASAHYVGSQACEKCHAEIYEHW
jgi:mono/diheme cytochrome c family protein